MSTRRFESDPVSKATLEVSEFLRIALQQRFLDLPTLDILCAAESVWNNYEPGRRPPSFEESGVDAESLVFQELVEELHRARNERFGQAPFFIFALDYEYEAKDILFTCDLMWTGGSSIHPFLLRMSRHSLGPPERN